MLAIEVDEIFFQHHCVRLGQERLRPTLRPLVFSLCCSISIYPQQATCEMSVSFFCPDSLNVRVSNCDIKCGPCTASSNVNVVEILLLRDFTVNYFISNRITD